LKINGKNNEIYENLNMCILKNKITMGWEKKLSFNNPPKSLV
jgi:hypothetical protein